MPEQDAPITLDQLRVFLAVVEEGSFSKAAKRLRRVQSAVSYSIANLERLLDVPLFDRAGRIPVLTEAGRAILVDARAVDERVDRLHARARSIASGVEGRISIAVEMMFPQAALLTGLAAFNERYPSVDLHLRTEALGAVTQAVLDGECQLGISIDLGAFPRSLVVRPLTTIEMVPVAAPSHRLAQLDAQIAEEDLSGEVQIVITDRSARTAGVDHGVLSDRTWRVADLEAKRALMVAGFGWGSMPTHVVREDLEQGKLVPLSIGRWAGAPVQLALVSIARAADPPGTAGRWLLEHLAGRCGDAAAMSQPVD